MCTKTKIKARKKYTIPKRNESQATKVKILCDRLYRIYRHHKFIIDDESYFTSAHSSLNGNNIYYTFDVSETPSSVKYRLTAKFEEKILVLVAFSAKGISNLMFRKSGMAINQEVYRDQCIKKRLVPFIKKHHSDDRYIF